MISILYLFHPSYPFHWRSVLWLLLCCDFTPYLARGVPWGRVTQTLVQCGVSRNAEAVYPRRLVEYSDGGHRRREDEGSRDGDELVANLRRVTLTPRTHPLGGEGAHWGSTNISGDSYKRGDGVDIPEDEVRLHFYDTFFTPPLASHLEVDSVN